MSGSISVFAAMFAAALFLYFRRSLNLYKLEWDAETVTAADYTLEIPNFDGRLFWLDICEEMKLDTSYISAAAMRDKLIEFIEQNRGDLYNVAEVNFSFDNGAVIDLLRQRALQVKSKHLNQAKQTDGEIMELIRNDPDSLTTP
jgi:hypothetical protein